MTSENAKLARQKLELDRRVKELDAREEYLTKREQFLEDAPLSITILKESIKAKKKQMTAFMHTADDAEREHYEKLHKIGKQVKEKTVEFDSLTVMCTEVDADILVANETLIKLNTTKKSVQSEIDERQEYLANQEQLIADAIESGNLELRSLKYQMEPLVETRLQLGMDIVDLETQKTNLQFETAELLNEQNFILAQRDKVSEDVQKSLDAAQANLQEVSTKSKKVTDDTETKLRKLKAEEEKIIAERQSVAKERAELLTERRRWESTKSLYSI